MHSSKGETWRSSRTQSAILDSATESAKQAIEGQRTGAQAQCPGSLVETSNLRRRTKKSSQDEALSWEHCVLVVIGLSFDMPVRLHKVIVQFVLSRLSGPDDHYPLSPHRPIICSKVQTRMVVSGMILALLALNAMRTVYNLRRASVPALHVLPIPARTVTVSSTMPDDVTLHGGRPKSAYRLHRRHRRI
ncbi:hypothetical protein PCH_Pc21g03520 [Penicillium rubens Wisconsin 54-1255]|uniref:Uncharacterized protein n=1 Tax=Penicillium rubens (strain ATCC 28089 / DSM 1075 / NRRL 1951 / Wisconsin 54-1255) TaxID=500485 RepID=B6HLG9_PENRW|nr:hypothetical protein PCH_Pc21g03520 [Penicillium rubens Wisconsin 54-1255]